MLRWIPTTKDVPLATPVTVYGGQGGPRDMSWGEFLARQPSETVVGLQATLNAGAGVPPNRANTEGIDEGDEYYNSFPYDLEATSSVSWDGGSQSFGLALGTKVTCVLPPPTGNRVQFQVIMIYSRCISLTDAGTGWSHEASSKITVATGGMASTSYTVPSTGSGAAVWNRTLNSLDASGNQPGSCLGVAMLTDHRSRYANGSISTPWTPKKSIGFADGCLPVAPGSCDDDGGNDQLRLGPIEASTPRTRAGGVIRTRATALTVDDDEVVYPGPGCADDGGGGGGDGEADGYWRCFTTVTYIVETGDIIGVTRWCYFEVTANQNLRLSNLSAVEARALGGPASGAADVRSGNVRLVLKSNPADSAVQIVFYGDASRADEIVMGGGAVRTTALAGALAAWRELTATTDRDAIAPGTARRLFLADHELTERSKARFAKLAQDALANAVAAPEYDDPAFGRSRSIQIHVP